MQPFRVTCETCRARLKVSSASAIGQIHACPKCGSMVEIRPPSEERAAQPLATSSSASIEIGAAVMPTFDDVDVAMLPPQIEPPAESVETPAPAEASAGGGLALLWWGIAASVVLVIGGLGTVTWLRNDAGDAPKSPPIVQTPSQPASEVPSGAEGAESTIAETEATGTEPVVEESVAAPSSDSNIVTTDTPDAPAAEVALPELPLADAAPAEKLEVATKSQPTVDVAESTAPPAATTESKSPVMKFDPLDFDPAQFSFNEAVPAGGEDSNSIPKDADGAAVAGAEGPAADASKDAGAQAPPPAANPTLTMRLGPMPDAAPDPRHAAEQLATQLDSFTVTDVPLSRFVELVSDMSNVAITLDPIELELAGVSPTKAVSVDSKGVTVEKLLSDVFAKQRLEFVVKNDQFGIALAGGERPKEVVYDVADLTGGADANAMVELVQQFVAPDSWAAADGGKISAEGTRLRIHQSQRIRHEALIFFERLRIARGLPQRSKYPAQLLAVVSPYAAMSAKLQQPATFTFLPWARLADVLRHWQEASKLTVLVDWRELAALELGPSSPVACAALDRSWEDVLDETLEPIGLSWWAVDGNTIQITSEQAAAEIRRLEIHDIPKAFRDQFADNEAFVESLQAELSSSEANRPASSPTPVIQVDEPSGRLIVLGTPHDHRFLTKRFAGSAKHVAVKLPD